MGGRTPATFAEGMLSGLGHPVIGLDHFAAVVAVGCLAAAHRAGAALAVAFVVAMMAGVALHLHGATVPAAEILVALSVIVLGALMLPAADVDAPPRSCCLRLSALCTAMRSASRSYGAEQTPLYAYLLGLAVIQSAIALVAMAIARHFVGPSKICRHCVWSAPALPASDLQS